MGTGIPSTTMLANYRKKSNHIYSIKDEQGRSWETPEDVERAFADYFSDLFFSRSCRRYAVVLDSFRSTGVEAHE